MALTKGLSQGLSQGLSKGLTGATSGAVLTIGIGGSGTYTTSDGSHTATQASTTGVGSGAVFTVTITSGVIASIDSIDSAGSGYAVSDEITLSIPTATEVSAEDLLVLTVSS